MSAYVAKDYWVEGYAVGDIVDYSVSLTVGTFNLTGQAAGLRHGRRLSAAVGSFAITSNAATLKATRRVPAAAGTFTLTGVAVGLRVTRTLALATTNNFLQAKSSAWASRTVAQVRTDLFGTGLVSGETASRNLIVNSRSEAYTAVAADAGGVIYHPAADTTARTWTIPANSSVAYPIGTTLTFDNDIGAGALTIAITTDTLVLVGAGNTGSRTIASGGQATAYKVTSTRWRISGVGLT